MGQALRGRTFQLVTLVPTLGISFVFVYGFIAYSSRVSVSRWQGILPDLTLNDPWYGAYGDLAASPRFQADLRNITVFTILLITFAVGLGLLLALLVHKTLVAQGFFRTVFLLPYALSFIVTGVVWRWIFTPSTGANLLLQAVGVDASPGWITDPRVAGDVSSALEAVIPGGDFIQVELGVPLAIIPVVLAASWQLGGFAMANFLAALSTVPPELEEAASLDGASTSAYYRYVVLPWLRPMIITVVVILGHVALKAFDLVYAMVGSGPGFATDVPGIFVFDQTFRAGNYNLGAAASMVMLVAVSAVILPYLYRAYIKQDKS